MSFFNDNRLFLEMRKSTIKLTKHELNFARNTSYPLAKHQIVQKVSQLFQHLGQKLVHDFGNQTLFQSSEYKITRGENYRLMPYLVLDFPRISGKNFPITCRTFFWWGHYFSCTIMVQTVLIDLDTTAELLAFSRKTRLLVGDDLWEQDLNSAVYTKLNKLSPAEIKPILEQQEYLKIVTKIALNDYDNLEELATKAYGQMLSKICIKKDSPKAVF